VGTLFGPEDRVFDGDVRPRSRVAVAGAVLAFAAALGATSAGLGYRLEWWGLGTAFTVLRWSAYGGLAAAALSLAGAVLARPRGPRRGFVWALAGMAVAVTTAAIPYAQLRTARAVPPIHDISTDTETPPEFVAVVPLRAGAPNPPAYPGPAAAEQQRAAYPDLAPAALDVPPEEAFERALAVARDLGWAIVAADREAGRIEATDETFWFGFKDDVVVRVRAADGASRIDVRSKSRVGTSDVGANARRIRRFIEALGER